MRQSGIQGVLASSRTSDIKHQTSNIKHSGIAGALNSNRPGVEMIISIIPCNVQKSPLPSPVSK
jgi:hypothetical protein